MIDGQPVCIGDVVYILGIGAGTVISTNIDGGFTVRTGNGDVYYRAGGYLGNQRRVYWNDPFIVIPPKNRRMWRAFVKIATILFGQMQELYDMNKTDDTEDTEVPSEPVDEAV